MHLKNIPPQIVPREYWCEVEKLSKAALMDMVWSLAGQCVNHEDGSDDYREVIAKFRAEREMLLLARRSPDIR